jgi:hypothetical protein
VLLSFGDTLLEYPETTTGYPIEIKKHGRKAYSLIKFGLIFLAHSQVLKIVLIKSGSSQR